MTINGIGGKVHYWISRPNNNSKGALVFTHGLTANHTMDETKRINAIQVGYAGSISERF